MRLPGYIINAVDEAGVEIFYADRHTTKVWNGFRLRGEPMRYGGWYWMRESKGKVVQMDEDGPFRTESAAIRDAFVKLQLNRPGLR
jgi:hypothetical protein